MKELEKETQLQVTGGAVFGAACVLMAIALHRLLNLQRANIFKLCGRRYY